MEGGRDSSPDRQRSARTEAPVPHRLMPATAARNAELPELASQPQRPRGRAPPPFSSNQTRSVTTALADAPTKTNNRQVPRREPERAEPSFAEC